MAKHHRKVRTVDAMQLQHATTLTTPHGTMRSVAGDWLVTEGDRQFIVDDATFQAEWERTPDSPYITVAPWFPVTLPQPFPYLTYPQWGTYQITCNTSTTYDAEGK